MVSSAITIWEKRKEKIIKMGSHALILTPSRRGFFLSLISF